MSKWPVVPLSTVVSPVDRSVPVVAGTAYRTIGVKWWGEGAYERVTIDGSQTAAKTLSMVRQGDLIINKIWVRHGSVAVAAEDVDGCAASGEFPTFQPDEDRILPQWLHWICKTRGFWAACDDLSRGTSGKNRIRPEIFLTITIPLPPMDEQKRIVTRIQELESKIVEAQCLRTSGPDGLALLSSEVGRVFRNLGLSTAVRQFREFEPHVTSGPRNWGSRVVSTGVRFYRAQDISSNSQISDSNKAFIALPDSDQGRSAWLQPGDLMLVITGATVGRCALFTESAEPGYVNQHVAICRFSRPNLDPRFVLWGLRGPSGQEQLLGQRYGQGKPGLNLNNIRAIKLPIPGIAEQVRIVDYLNCVEARVNALGGLRDRTDTELSVLLPAILDRAFRGDL